MAEKQKAGRAGFLSSSNKTITWLLQEQQEQLPERPEQLQQEQLPEQPEQLQREQQLPEQQELQRPELQQQELQQQELLLPFGHKRSEPEPAERRAERNESFFFLNETIKKSMYGTNPRISTEWAKFYSVFFGNTSSFQGMQVFLKKSQSLWPRLLHQQP